jgi:hypothetical protein
VALLAAASGDIEATQEIYKFPSGLWNLQLDLDEIKSTRPKITALLDKHAGESGTAVVKDTGYRGSYFKDRLIDLRISRLR